MSVELEVRHLRFLVAVADHGSITRAAASLGMSQPSLSTQLKRIERSVGGRVFTRSRLGVEATAFGRGLLARARSVLREMNGLPAAAEPVDDRRFALGDAGVLLSAVVPRLVAELAADPHAGPPPTVRAHIDPAATVLVAMMRAGKLDAAVVSDVIDFRTVDYRAVPNAAVVPLEPVFVALARRHPLAGRAAVDLADLAGEQWCVNPHDNPGWLAALRAACARAGFGPRVAYECSHMAGARALVAGGQCVAIADPLSAEGPDVVFRPLAGDPVRGRVDLAWVDPCPVPPALLRKVVAESYLDMVDHNPTYRRWWSEHGGVLT